MLEPNYTGTDFMDIKAVRGGDLSAIQEFEIGSSPLTIGTSPSCDIILMDPDGRIAGEDPDASGHRRGQLPPP